MTKHEIRFVNEWPETVRKGKLRFIFIRGVFGYGIFMFLTMSLIANPLASMAAGKPASIEARNVLINLIIWPIAGYFYGIWVYRMGEKRYIKLTSTVANQSLKGSA